MRLATIRIDGDTTVARVDEGEMTLLPHRDVRDLLESGANWAARAGAAVGRQVPVKGADFAPLIPQPEKIICVGANYQCHLDEIGHPAPKFPAIFAKYSRSLIGAYDPIELPAVSDCPDWEVELGVIIGRETRSVPVARALDAVAGYTIVNDVSMRDWQLRTSQFLQGKTFERTTPVGPYLVTPDEVDHARDLLLRCLVDGTVTQHARSSEMLYPVAEVIAYVSSILTLVPGDLIATGTPAGIGAARAPAVYLRDGSLLETTIEGLGRQANRCRAARPVAAV